MDTDILIITSPGSQEDALAQSSRFSGNSECNCFRKSGRSIGRARRSLARAARSAVALVNNSQPI